MKTRSLFIFLAAIYLFLHMAQIALPSLSDARAFYREGSNLLLKGDYARAIAYFNKAIINDPQMIEAYVDMGLALRKIERYNEARDFFKRAVNINPQMPLAHLYYGMILAELGEYEEALTAYQEAVKLKPDLSEIGESQYLKGRILMGMGETDEALFVLEKARAINPSLSEDIDKMLSENIQYKPSESPEALLTPEERPKSNDSLSSLKECPFEPTALENITKKDTIPEEASYSNKDKKNNQKDKNSPQGSESNIEKIKSSKNITVQNEMAEEIFSRITVNKDMSATEKLKLLETIINECPDSEYAGDAEKSLIGEYEKMEMFDKAATLYEKLISENSYMPDGEYMFYALKQGMALEQAGRKDAAKEIYLKIIKRDNGKNSKEALEATKRLKKLK